MRCRKNYRDLTTVERDRLIQALYHVKAAGIVDQYASEHETHFSHGIHTVRTFCRGPASSSGGSRTLCAHSTPP